jgi:hypothetical protein
LRFLVRVAQDIVDRALRCRWRGSRSPVRRS